MNVTQSDSQPTLSVALATYNEAANLPRCLKSIKGIADEIIIVDGTSTDDTVSIAKKYGAKVIVTTNKPVFHINKQIAMDAAQGALVLQLDADETVDTELALFLKQLKIAFSNSTYDTKNKPVAWWIRRKNLFLGTFLKKGGQYPDPVIRLYINGFAKLPQKDVHEQMVVSGSVETAAGHLIHYSNPTFADYLRKWNAYSSLAAAELQERKTDLSLGLLLEYFLYKPAFTFVSLYIRHKGFVDGFPGFVFALMSGALHQITILKYWEILQKTKI